MSLYTVTNGGTINAADVNQVVNMLQAPGGSTETAAYFLAGSGYTSGAYISQWIVTRNRWTGPGSVTLTTATQAPTGGLNAPTVGNIDPAGFQLYSTVTGASVNARCGGTYTCNF